MIKLNEDFFDDQSVDIENTENISSVELKQPSYDNGFEYRFELTCMIKLGTRLGENGSHDFMWIYNEFVMPTYRFLERASDFVDYSEIAIQSSDRDKYYLYSKPDSIVELKRDVEENYHIKNSYIRLTFFANVSFKARRVLYLINSLGSASKCPYMQIFKSESDVLISKIDSLIPLSYILRDTQKDKDYWLTGKEISFPNRDKSHNLGDIYETALSLAGKNLNNYIIFRDIINYPNAIDYIFDNIVKEEMNTKVKHFNIKQSIKNALDNGSFNIDYICSDDCASLFFHDVTTPFDTYEKYTLVKNGTADISVDYLRQGFSGRKLRIQKWDMFLHDTKRSYGRFVSALFYIGPCCYNDKDGKTIVAETYLAFDLYDARSSWFAKKLGASLQEPLDDKDVTWLFDKTNKTI